MKKISISSRWKRLLIGSCAALTLCGTGLALAAFLFTLPASAMEQPGYDNYQIAHGNVLAPNAVLALQGTIRPELVGHWRYTNCLPDCEDPEPFVTDYHVIFLSDGMFGSYSHDEYDNYDFIAEGTWSATENMIVLVGSDRSSQSMGYQFSDGYLYFDGTSTWIPGDSSWYWEFIGIPELPTAPPATEPPTTAPPTTEPPTAAPPTEAPTTPSTTEPPTTAPSVDAPTTPPPTTVPPTTSNGGTPGRHIVRRGETLYCIGRGYRVLPMSIATSNNLSSPYRIFPGQTLIIPNAPWNQIPSGPICQRQFDGTSVPGTPVPTTPIPNPVCRATYIVVRGDTLFRISRAYGVNVTALASVNGIANRNLIYPGQRLCIP